MQLLKMTDNSYHFAHLPPKLQVMEFKLVSASKVAQSSPLLITRRLPIMTLKKARLVHRQWNAEAVKVL
jgi:hypothetical protein